MSGNNVYDTSAAQFLHDSVKIGSGTDLESA